MDWTGFSPDHSSHSHACASFSRDGNDSDLISDNQTTGNTSITSLSTITCIDTADTVILTALQDSLAWKSYLYFFTVQLMTVLLTGLTSLAVSSKLTISTNSFPKWSLGHVDKKWIWVDSSQLFCLVPTMIPQTF